MAYVLAILYGVYLIAVGFAGNAGGLVSLASQDVGYVTWLIAIAVLVAIDSSPTLSPIAAPFLGLAVMTFVVMQFPTLKANALALWNGAGLSTQSTKVP